MVRAKRHRLPVEDYVGRDVAFTICTLDHKPAFQESWVVQTHLDMLWEATQRHGCTVPIFCYMPEHVHLIVSGRERVANPLTAVKSYKAMSARWFAEHGRNFARQDDFYDHIIRGPEDYRKQVFYIYRNPKKRGLVEDPALYPHLGSLCGPLQEVLYWALPD